MRFRNIFVVVGSFLTLLLLYVSDPETKLIQNIGSLAGTIVVLTIIAKGVLGAALLYIVRKAMFDYPVADFEELGKSATRTPEGAGMYSIGYGLMMIAFAIIIVGVILAA